MAEQSARNAPEPQEPVSAVERNIFLYLVLYLIFSTYQFGSQLSSATLYPPDRAAMDWVSTHTPAEARFLVLTGTTSVSCDSVLEWFPALTERQSIYTVQGTEWTQGKNFTDYAKSTYSVQECLSTGDASCLDTAIARSKYDYIYISKILRVNNCVPLDIQRSYPLFLESMRLAPDFRAVYDTDDVAIFQKK